MFRRRLKWLWLALSLGPGAVLALSADREQPVDIEADRVELNERQGISVYSGNVKLTQGSLRLTADTMTIYNTGDKIERIILVGEPATYRQTPDNQGEDMRAEARQVEYYADERKVILLDNAKLWQGPNQFRSDRIVYDLTRDVVNAGDSDSGRQRVHITIQPPGEAQEQPAPGTDTGPGTAQ